MASADLRDADAEPVASSASLITVPESAVRARSIRAQVPPDGSGRVVAMGSTTPDAP